MDTNPPLEPPDTNATEPAEAEGATPMDSPELFGVLDYEEFAAQEQARARRNKVLLGVGAAICALVIPFAYLGATGRFSTAQFTERNVAAQPSAKSAPSVPVVMPAESPQGLDSSGGSPVDPAVAQDLHDYLWNGVERLAPEEQLALKAYLSVTGKDYHNSAASFKTVRETVIPRYSAFVHDAAKLHPKTKEVQAIQTQFMTSLQLRLLAYRHILEGEHAKDDSWRLTVGAEFQAAEAASGRFQQDVQLLAQRNGVELPH